jgi:chemotaxis protein MotB
MMEQPEEQRPRGAPEWIVTFADLMSLLLTFFVLLLSFSNMEIIKFRTMAGSVRNALGLKSEFDLADVPRGSSILPYHNPREGDGHGEIKEADSLRDELRRIVRSSGVPVRGTIQVLPQSVALQLEGDLLFDSGSAELKAESFPILNDLAELIRRVEYRVDVLGHTDSLPIATAVFPSNWELSGARAGRAVRYLAEQSVAADRLRAVGHADTHPVAANDTAESRSLNRRVEFVFRTSVGEKKLPGEDQRPPSQQPSQLQPKQNE